MGWSRQLQVRGKKEQKKGGGGEKMLVRVRNRACQSPFSSPHPQGSWVRIPTGCQGVPPPKVLSWLKLEVSRLPRIHGLTEILGAYPQAGWLPMKVGWCDFLRNWLPGCPLPGRDFCKLPCLRDFKWYLYQVKITYLLCIFYPFDNFFVYLFCNFRWNFIFIK